MGDNAMEYRILGPIEVLRSQQQVALDGSKQRTVLAALLTFGLNYAASLTEPAPAAN